MNTAIEMLMGLWKFLILMTSTAPLGVWSFLIAVIFPAIFPRWLDRRLPDEWHRASRDVIVETIALVFGILLAWLPWQTLNGFLVGIMAGFMSPYLTKVWLAGWGIIFRWWARRLGFPPEAPCEK